MTAPPRIFTRLLGTKADGTPSAVKVAPRVISGVSRALGINGAERVGLIVPRAVETPATGFADVWPPEDWDLAKPMTLEFGLVDEADDETNKVVIGGLRLLQQDPTSFGVPADADNIHNTAITSTAQEMELVLAPITALWGDGRGGLIRSKVWNPLRADGTVDTADTATYRTNSQLIFEAAAATGLTATLTSPQQTDLDSFPPPAPLDWSNREAPPELDALCARLGYAPVLGLSGETLRFVRLPKAGESITPPSWVTANAEPYELSQAISLRGQTIVVHSGDTRSIAVTTLNWSNLEWVWFDERTGRWLNDAETASLYSGEVQPGSLAAFKAQDPTKREQLRRIFRAVRITDAALRAKLARMVPFPGATSGPGGTIPGGKTAAIVEGYCCEPRGGGQLRHLGFTRVAGAKVHAGQGVIVLPTEVVWVWLTGLNQGDIADATALPDEGTNSLRVTVAYEVNTGVFDEQTYWQAFRATASAGVVTVAALEGTERTDALDDPESIKIRAEFLQRVGVGTVAQVFTWSNTAELDAIALKIATARAGGTDLSPGGTIELRGWHDKLPGLDWAWCSRIEWFVAQGQIVTRLTIGSHQTSGSGFDIEEAEARRSVAAGLARFSLAGSAAARSDVRSGGAPGDGSPASLRVAGGMSADTRGAESRVPGAAVVATPAAEQQLPATTSWIARITGATSLGNNRWSYNWTAVSLTDAGVTAVPAASPRTHATTGYGTARNLAEMGNAATGVQGNGVDVADLTGTLAIRPIPTGRIVQMSGPFGTSGAPFCVFTAENGLQGACA